MKKIKKITAILLILTIIFNVKIFGNTEINYSSTIATVIDILDTDAIKVNLPETNDIAYVKIKGIKGNGYNEGYKYLVNTILGEKVVLVKSNSPYFDGKWNYMTVIYSGMNIGTELVANGYAVIDNTNEKTTSNTVLYANQDLAKAYSLGVWKYTDKNYSTITGGNKNPYYTKEKVNINTASLYHLKTLLRNVSNEVANSIIAYRNQNPFTKIEEIKFVNNFTKNMYIANKDIMTVSTNINNATEYELSTVGFNATQIEKILEKRAQREYKNTYELVPEIISNVDYNKIKYFINTIDTREINYIYPSFIANIGGSAKTYLQKVISNTKIIDEIIQNRKNGYTYKTLMELSKFKVNSLSELEINYLEDNLKTHTNLNSSNKEELIYLFGDTVGKKIYANKFNQKEDLKKYINNYDNYKDIVYVEKNTEEYININTATKQELEEIGLTSLEATQIISKRPFATSQDLPFNISKVNEKVSLYTNINKATIKELKSLGFNETIINGIKNYILDQPFGSKQEIKEYFTEKGYIGSYNKAEKYIVIR